MQSSIIFTVSTQITPYKQFPDTKYNVNWYSCNFRPPSGNFDSVLRNRYFPGGPTPDGLDSDIMFKNNMADSDHFHADLRERSRRESEEMMTDNRCWTLILLVYFIHTVWSIMTVPKVLPYYDLKKSLLIVPIIFFEFYIV